MNLGVLVVALMATIAWSSVHGGSFSILDEFEVTEHGHVRAKRDLTCSDGQTMIVTPLIYVTTTDTQYCASATSSLSNDFYNTIYTTECQRWLGLSTTPISVGFTSLLNCIQYPNNTAVYQMAVCCIGTVTTVRCFTNAYLTQTDNYGANYHGTVQTCAADQLCQTKYTFQGSACTVNKRYITKGCVAASDCQSAASSPLCSDFATTPECATCCNSAFCNLQINETLTKKPGTCSVSNATAPRACNPNPCNGGVCIPKTNPRTNVTTITCNCRIGYTGTYCDQQQPMCPSDSGYSCDNGGTCFLYDTTNVNDIGFRCYCPPGFIGEYCQYTNRLPCQPGDNTYTDDPGESFQGGLDCDIMQGFSVPSMIDGFLSTCTRIMQIPNGPVFVNGVNGQVSATNFNSFANEYCRHGWDYVFYKYHWCCPACLSVPCQNRGYCIDIAATNSYICSCPIGFTGKNCEHRVSLCVCSGEPHCRTFDNLKIDYQGRCKHILAESASGYTGPNQFHVYMRNEHRGSNTLVSFPKDLVVDVCGHHIELQRDPTSTAFVPVVIQVNGVTYRPPYRGPCYVVDLNGPYMRLDTNFGLSAEFDGRWLVIVQVPGDYRGLTHGVCGNNNGNATDDQVTCDGQYVGNYEDPGSYIGNSCVVSEPNPPTSNCSVPPNNQTCLPALLESATRRCSLMTNRSAEFGNCIVGMGANFANSYLENCIFDACFFNESSICDTLAAFAQDCFRNGYAVPPTWRTTAGCPLPCPVGMVPATNVKPCIATCDNPTAADFCPYPATETCICPPGQILFNGKCVGCCGCYDENGVPRESGSSWTTRNCTTFSCNATSFNPYCTSSIQVLSPSCAPNEICQVSSGTGGSGGTGGTGGSGGSGGTGGSGGSGGSGTMMGQCVTTTTTTPTTTTTTPTTTTTTPTTTTTRTTTTTTPTTTTTRTTTTTTPTTTTTRTTTTTTPTTTTTRTTTTTTPTTTTTTPTTTTTTPTTTTTTPTTTTTTPTTTKTTVTPAPQCTSVDGNWCAFGPWSACVNGVQTRTRSCGCPTAGCFSCSSPNNCNSCVATLPDGSVIDCPALTCPGPSTESRTCCSTVFNAQVACQTCDFTMNPAGYVADPCNCTWFYQCVWINNAWTAYRMPCPPCLCWSPSTLVCSDLANPSIPLTDPSCKPAGVTASPNNTTCQFSPASNAYQYIWVGNVMPCPNGTVFDIKACGCVTGSATSSTGRLFCLDFDNSYLLNGMYVSMSNVIVDYFWNPQSAHGKQAYFNGNSAWIEVPALSNVQWNQFGISLWFQRIGSDTASQGLFYNGDCKQFGSIRAQSTDQNRVTARVTTTSANVTIFNKTASYNTWHHLALSYDGTYFRMYVDKVLVGTEAISGPTVLAACPLVFGHNFVTDMLGLSGGWFNGYMDNICFYNRAFSTSQINDLFNLLVV